MNALVVVSTFEPIPQGYCAALERERHLARRARFEASAPDGRMVELRRLADIDNAAFDIAAAWRRHEADIVAKKEAAHLAILASRRARSLRPPIQTIQRIVAETYDITADDIISRSRKAYHVFPRMVAVYLAKQITAKSLPEIGRRFGGRDHTTLLHSLKKIGAKIAANPEFAVTVGLLRAEIESDA